jgi:hypothetical protein
MVVTSLLTRAPRLKPRELPSWSGGVLAEISQTGRSQIRESFGVDATVTYFEPTCSLPQGSPIPDLDLLYPKYFMLRHSGTKHYFGPAGLVRSSFAAAPRDYSVSTAGLFRVDNLLRSELDALIRSELQRTLRPVEPATEQQLRYISDIR